MGEGKTHIPCPSKTGTSILFPPISPLHCEWTWEMKMKAKSKCLRARLTIAGFTLIELMIVLTIIVYGALAASRQLRAYLLDLQAKAVADNITLIGKAVASYIPKNTATLSVGPMYSDLTILQLQNDNDLSSGFFGTTPWGSGYKIRIQRMPGPAPYLYKALVFTATSWVIDTAYRIDLVGEAVKKIGGAGGMTYDGTGPTGNGGAWSEPASSFIPSVAYDPKGGQLFYNVAFSLLSLDAVYLRTDGGNMMNAELQMNSNGIVGATTIAASSLITADALTTTNAVNAGSLTASGAVTGGNVTTLGAVNAGTVTATGDITSQNGAVNANTDVTISSLTSRTSAPGVTSLKTLAPKLVELYNYVIDTNAANLVRYNNGSNNAYGLGTAVDGTRIPVPMCEVGGTPNIFIIPQKETGTAMNGMFGAISLALGPAGGFWTLDVKDAQTPSNSVPSINLPNYGSIVRTFCSY